MGVPVHGRVRRRSYVCWFGVVHRKKEYTSWETLTGRLVYNVHRKKEYKSWETLMGKLVYNIHRKKEYTSWETLTGRLVYNVLFKKTDCKIAHYTGLQLEEKHQKYEEKISQA